MTPTPHPADALPLPEPALHVAFSDDGEHIRFWTSSAQRAALWSADNWPTDPMYSEAQYRAARREGYELAMSKTTALVDALDGLLCALPDVLPQSGYERSVRTGKRASGNSYSLRGHTGKIEYRADDMEVVYSAIDAAAQALVKPIHDPAVTTPREVLVGESPVDRIAAPAQEHVPVSAEESAAIDATLDLFTLPPIRVSEAVYVELHEQAKASGVIVQAHVRQLLEQQQAGAAEVSDERIESLWRFFADTSHVIRIERFQFDQLVRGIAKLLPERVSDEQIEAAAKIVAERFDYPWAHMPEEGRNHMRDTARAVLALSQGGK